MTDFDKQFRELNPPPLPAVRELPPPPRNQWEYQLRDQVEQSIAPGKSWDKSVKVAELPEIEWRG